MSKLYSHRDTRALGIHEHYFRNIEAMTSEGLHKKSHIAAELAVRDARIAELEEALKFSHEAAVRYERQLTMDMTPQAVADQFDDVFPDHPLLAKDRSSLLADAAKVDGDYL